MALNNVCLQWDYIKLHQITFDVKSMSSMRTKSTSEQCPDHPWPKQTSHKSAVIWGLWPGLHPIQSGTHIHSTLTIQYRLGRRSITVAVALSHFLRLVMRDHATDEVNCRITDEPGTFATTITTITTSTTDGKQTSVSQHVTRAADCFSAQPVWNRCQHPHTKRGKTRTVVKLPVLGKSLTYIEIWKTLKVINLIR